MELPKVWMLRARGETMDISIMHMDAERLLADVAHLIKDGAKIIEIQDASEWHSHQTTGDK